MQSFIFTSNEVNGVILDSGEKIFSHSVILTAGTFLDGVIHLGEKKFSSGRSGDPASIELERFFSDNGFATKRLKTGTPPRIKTQSINFDNLLRQDSDTPLPMLSYVNDHYEQAPVNIKKIPCYITHTNSVTHKIIHKIKINHLYSTGK